MTAQMITVQGDLLLPSLNPMANQVVSFGGEWTMTPPRPAQNGYEIPIYAARFATRYVDASVYRRSAFQYQPVSFWGRFNRVGVENEGALAAVATPAPVTPVAPVAPEVAASAKPSTFAKAAAPADRPASGRDAFSIRSVPAARPSSRAARARAPGNRRMAWTGGGIALAGIALIAALLFGSHRGDNATNTVQTASREADTPAVVASAVAQPDTPSRGTTATLSASRVTVSAAASGRVDAANVKLVKPVKVAAANSPKLAQAKKAPAERRAAAKITNVAAVAPPASSARKSADARALRRVPSAAEDIYPLAPATAKAAQRARPGESVAVAAPVRTVSTAPNPRVTEPAAIRVADQEPADPAPRRVVSAAPAVASPAIGARGLTVAELYGMLQHSPTLDDNSPSAPRSVSSGAPAGRSIDRRTADTPATLPK